MNLIQNLTQKASELIDKKISNPTLAKIAHGAKDLASSVASSIADPGANSATDATPDAESPVASYNKISGWDKFKNWLTPGANIALKWGEDLGNSTIGKGATGAVKNAILGGQSGAYKVTD